MNATPDLVLPAQMPARATPVRRASPVVHAAPGASRRLPQAETKGGFFSHYGIAIAVALVAHAALALSGTSQPKAAPLALQEAETPSVTVTLAQDDVVENDFEETPHDEPVAAGPIGIAVPQLVDVPSVVFDTSFVQPVQPTAPQFTGASLLSVPKGPVSSAAVAKRIGQVFDLASLDQAPEIRFKINPMYPSELQATRMQGQVLVTFVVTDSGEVRDIEIISSTHPAFESSALQAIRKWKFKPGRKGGAAVSTRMEQPVRFSLHTT